MKAMTIEQKQAYFATYYGQNVGYDLERAGASHVLIGAGINCCDYIKLKPTSSITDEDALKIAEILYFRGDKLIETVKEFLEGEDHWLNKHVDIYRHMRMIDFIRSRGYATSFLEFTEEDLVANGVLQLES